MDTANLILIGVTVLTTLYAWQNENIFNRWIFSPRQVRENNEWYRLLTSGFIHANWAHLLFNMITLYFFGDTVIYAFQVYSGNGVVLYLVMYLTAIIISELPSYFRHKENRYYRSLGASGGVSAVIFAYILFFPTNMLYLFGIVPIPGFLLGILFIIYSYYQGKQMGGRVNHDAHLYGALYGLIFAVVLAPGAVTGFFEQIRNFRLF